MLFSWKNVPYLFLIFFAFATINLFDFVERTIDWSQVTDPAYWEEVLLITFANITILVSISDLYVMKHIEDLEDNPKENAWWHELKKAIYKGVAKLKPNFTLFIDNFNLERKKRAFKRKISKKLQFWEFFASHDTRVLVETPNKDLSDEDIKKKQKNWWYKKRSKLNAMLTDEYINERVPYMRLRYPKIKSSFVKVGHNDDKYDEDMVVETKTSKLLRDHGPRIILITGIMAFARSLMLGINEEMTWIAIFMIFLRSAALVYAGITGKRYSKDYLHGKIVKDEYIRLDVLKKYYEEEGEMPNELNISGDKTDRVDRETKQTKITRRPSRAGTSP